MRTVIINGHTYGIAPYSLIETPRRITGPNSGVSLDGTLIEDLVAIKYDISLELMPLTASELNQLAQDISTAFVEVSYFSAVRNQTVTLEMKPEPSSIALILLKGIGASDLYGNFTIAFKQR